MEYKQIFFRICQTILFTTCLADEDIFTDYCMPGLCKYNGGDGMHTGCKDNVRHSGGFQYPPCKVGGAQLLNLTEQQKQNIVDYHNYQRNYLAGGGLMHYWGFKAACRMGTVLWDKELEQTAWLHLSYCTMAHDKCRNTFKYKFSGQNLSLLLGKMVSNISRYLNENTIMWYLEYQDAWPEIIDNYQHIPEDQPMIGHFLVVVNEKSTRIGCVLGYIFESTKQRNGAMMSCNYAMTNIKRTPVYNTCKVPASKCLTGTNPKYKYLCSEKEEYDWGRKLKFEKYDGDGTETYDVRLKPPEVVQHAHVYRPLRTTTGKPGGAKPAPAPAPAPKPAAPAPAPAPKPSAPAPAPSRPKPSVPAGPMPTRPRPVMSCSPSKLLSQSYYQNILLIMLAMKIILI